MKEKNSRLNYYINSRFHKERILLKLSEDDFRDLVIRPLLIRQGFIDGRDVCGLNEKGKDAVFLFETPFNKDIYVLQSKKGNFNLSSKNKENVLNVTTQLRTSLETPIYFLANKTKQIPTKSILCVSGKINESAKIHIVDSIKDNRVIFMDSDDIIPLIDKFYPEFWMEIEAELSPYFKAIIRSVEDKEYNSFDTDILPHSDVIDAATDAMYINLRLYRSVTKKKLFKGLPKDRITYEEFPIIKVVNKKYPLILILGEAGSGKSTALRRIAYILAKKGIEGFENYKIPILLRATEICKQIEIKNLHNIAFDETKKLSKESKPCFTQKDLLNGNVIILIDALDEVFKLKKRISLVEAILDFHKLYPLCKIILTSRDFAFIRGIKNIEYFNNFYISPISFNEVDSILKRFEKNKLLSRDESKELLRRLEEIHGLDLNPLLVTVFAATSDFSRKDLPANITELFKKYTEMMLGRWDQSKGLTQQYQAPLKDFLLQKVGYELHRRKTTNIEIFEFKNLIRTELINRGHSADIEDLTQEIINRSGLFRITSNRVEFRHHLLQEFFAGRGIPNEELLELYISDERWQNAIVFYFGEKATKGERLKDLINVVEGRTTIEKYISVRTIGLSLQASYLVLLNDKIEIIKWVIKTLSLMKFEFDKVYNDPKSPNINFIMYYLIGRDSVACSILNEKVEVFTEDKFNDEEYLKETIIFWIIVGLMEIGNLGSAERLINKFKPKDSRLFLGIYLSCIIIANARIVSTEQKKLVNKISSEIYKKIENLHQEILEELKSDILEIRKGKVFTLNKN